MTVDLESSHHSVLVGRYFHSFKEMDGRKVVDGQGQVVEQINDKYYLVRTRLACGNGVRSTDNHPGGNARLALL